MIRDGLSGGRLTLFDDRCPATFEPHHPTMESPIEDSGPNTTPPSGIQSPGEVELAPAPLPVELWFQIFSYLDRRSDALSAALVSRRLCGPGLERLWRDGPVPHSAASFARFLRVLANGKPLRDIGAGAIDEDDEDAWTPPTEDSPERQHLRQSGCLVPEPPNSQSNDEMKPEDASDDVEDCLKTPAEYGRCVRRVEFRCDWNGRRFMEFDRRIVSFLLTVCPNLRVLDLRCGINVPVDLRIDAPRATNLVELRLPWTPLEAVAHLLDLSRVRVLDLHVDPAKLNEVLASMPSVRSFTFTRHGRPSAIRSNESPPDTPIPDVSNISLGGSTSSASNTDSSEEEYLPDLPPSLVLARLVGAAASSNTDDQTKLLTRLAQIHHLAVRHTRMKDLLVLDKLTSLESLYLHDLPNLPQILVATSASWGPRLKRLYLCSRSNMFEVGFLLRQLDSKNLRELTLKCTSPMRRRTDLTEPINYAPTPSPQNTTPITPLGFLPTLFPRLTFLRLEGFEIADIDLFLSQLSLPKGPRLTLRTLALSDQPRMAPDPLLDCLRRLSCLEALSLGACNIDDRVAAEILAPSRRRSDSASSSASSDLPRRPPPPRSASKLRLAMFPRNKAITLTELPGLLEGRALPPLEMLDFLATRATEDGADELKRLPGFGKVQIRVGPGPAGEDEDWIIDPAFD